MNKNGPIVIVEDDQDDQELLSTVFKELGFPNEVVFFSDGEKAFEYLLHSRDNPFLVMSDINMPKLDGFELRDKVHKNAQLRLKCIPYLFFTTSASKSAVIDAYSKSVQGFFVKPQTYNELKRVIGNIIHYWQDCHSPNTVAEAV